jgi:cysteine desulfurase/selenocysteine lyase
MTIFPVEKIRSDFPILQEKIRNKPLVYLDNAASCQKPQQVSFVLCALIKSLTFSLAPS